MRKIIYHPGKKLYLILFLGFSSVIFSLNDKNKIQLYLETPESGSAVSTEDENEYLRTKPVLRSEIKDTDLLEMEIDLSPNLQKLILPGSENSDVNNTEEEIYLGNIGLRAAQKALEFYEKKIKTVTIKGTVLNIEKDCSSFVRAAYWEGSGHTIDLFRESIISNSVDPKKITGGVKLLAEYLQKNRRYQPGNPKIGDIIIFDNTYDKNQNQIRDDYFTHTGIVTQIRSDKTIEFIHGNISHTVKKGYINFIHPDSAYFENQPVNSYIRPRYSWEKETETSLASHLVRSFGGL